MIPRSYAGDEQKWLLFVREDEAGAFVFTVVIHNVVAESRVDDDALKEHSDELGLEMEADAFKTLLEKALEQRSCVDVEIETEEKVAKEVYLSLTYKFSPTISRKGVLKLPIVAMDAPQNLVTLLSSIHVTPPQSMLSELQKRKNEEKKVSAIAKSSVDLVSSTISSQESKSIATASQSTENETITAVNPMLLKRRHVPTGTMRRKGPRGAKLAKK